MSDTNKLFQKIVNGQSAMKQAILKEVKKVDSKLSGRMDTLEQKLGKLDKKIDKGFKEVNNRLDKQGKSLAYLEDDAPTVEEFDKLEERVTEIEDKVLHA
ncbi:hypothetical protein JXA63_00805 [Candidatus Woesebacteria bacterium]|nr:hypothetical protein [Candidatus Woesebacteria bacterium]